MVATRQPRTMSVSSGQQPAASTPNSTTSSEANTPTPIDPFSIASLGKMDRNKITLLSILYTDGQAEVASANGGMAPNRPPAEMIKKPTEDVGDLTAYYKPCLPNDNRDLAWRAELGTLLVAQMDPARSGGNLYCLKSWPEGYALFDRYAHTKAGVSWSYFVYDI